MGNGAHEVRLCAGQLPRLRVVAALPGECACGRVAQPHIHCGGSTRYVGVCTLHHHRTRHLAIDCWPTMIDCGIDSPSGFVLDLQCRATYQAQTHSATTLGAARGGGGGLMATPLAPQVAY